MDPNAALARIREELAALDAYSAGDDSEAVASHAFDLAELLTGLDEWLSKGGFLPSEWMPAIDAHAEESNYCPACGAHRKEDHRADCPYVVEGRVDPGGRDARNGNRLYRWAPTVEDTDYGRVREP